MSAGMGEILATVVANVYSSSRVRSGNAGQGRHSSVPPVGYKVSSHVGGKTILSPKHASDQVEALLDPSINQGAVRRDPKALLPNLKKQTILKNLMKQKILKNLKKQKILKNLTNPD